MHVWTRPRAGRRDRPPGVAPTARGEYPAVLRGALPPDGTRPLPSPVRDVTSENFGLLIAYLLPGFVALWGVSPAVPGAGAWLAAPPVGAPTVGGFLYL